MRFAINTFVFVLLASLLVNCSSTKQSQKEDQKNNTVVVADTAKAQQASYLHKYRNTLKDRFATQQHDMPPVFLKKYQETEEVEKDPFDGFRIQILSTRKVAIADSAAKNFRLWADTAVTDFNPKPYIIFNQPHYKVHVGDFQKRERAIRFSNRVKSRFPNAWVVHDRINPYLVPADSLEIK